MMLQPSSAFITSLESQYANNPTYAVMVEWTSGTLYYTDVNAITGVGASVLRTCLKSIGNISESMRQDVSSNFQSVSVVLVDRDNDLYDKFANYYGADIPASVIMYYGAESQVLLSGKIRNGMAYDEGNRTLTLIIEHQIPKIRLSDLYAVDTIDVKNTEHVAVTDTLTIDTLKFPILSSLKDKMLPSRFGTVNLGPLVKLYDYPVTTLKTAITHDPDDNFGTGGIANTSFTVEDASLFPTVNSGDDLYLRIGKICVRGTFSGNVFTMHLDVSSRPVLYPPYSNNMGSPNTSGTKSIIPVNTLDNTSYSDDTYYVQTDQMADLNGMYVRNTCGLTYAYRAGRLIYISDGLYRVLGYFKYWDSGSGSGSWKLIPDYTIALCFTAPGWDQSGYFWVSDSITEQVDELFNRSVVHNTNNTFGWEHLLKSWYIDAGAQITLGYVHDVQPTYLVSTNDLVSTPAPTFYANQKIKITGSDVNQGGTDYEYEVKEELAQETIFTGDTGEDDYTNYLYEINTGTIISGATCTWFRPTQAIVNENLKQSGTYHADAYSFWGAGGNADYNNSNTPLTNFWMRYTGDYFADSLGSAGNDATDVLKSLIDTYLTTVSTDATSFTNVATSMGANEPNLGLYIKSDVDVWKLCNDIASQLNCFLRLRNDTVYLLWRSRQGTYSTSLHLTASSIILKSFVVKQKPLNNLITTVELPYATDFSATSPELATMTNNASTYGDKIKRFSPVLFADKAGADWAVNYFTHVTYPWYYVSFKTTMTAMRLEAFDMIALTLNKFVGMTGFVTNVSFSIKNNEVTISAVMNARPTLVNTAGNFTADSNNFWHAG